jgi:hypothetical protein
MSKTVTKVSDTSPLFHICSEGASGISNRTPQSVMLVQKLTGSELVKELPAFYGSRTLATLLTRVTPEPDKSTSQSHSTSLSSI